MQNSLWKLAALAGVIGLGFLVVLQAQRGLTIPGLPEKAKAPADPDSPQAALEADDEPPAGELGGAAKLTQVAPAQNRGAADFPDPFTSEEPANEAPRWPAAAQGEPDPRFDFANEPAAPRVGAASSRADLPAEHRGASPGAARTTSGEPNDPFAMSADDSATSPGADDPFSGTATPAATDRVPVRPRAGDAGSVRLTASEGQQPSRFESDTVPVRSGAAPRNEGPAFGAPAELDDTGTASARPLPDAAQPIIPLPDSSNARRMAMAPRAAEAQLAQAGHPFGGNDRPTEADPFSGPSGEGGPSRDSFGTDSRPAGRAHVPEAAPTEPTASESEDPFGPFMVREELPSPGVEEPSAAFPERDAAGDLERTPALDRVPVVPERSGEMIDLPPSRRPRASDPVMPEPAERDDFGRTESDEPGLTGSETRSGIGRDDTSTSRVPPVREYERETYPDPLGGAAATEPRAPRPSTPDRVPVDRGPAVVSGDIRGDATAEPRAPRGAQRPQLKIEKVAPPTATLGEKLVYEIKVKNVGDSPAYEVVVEDRVPKGSRLEGTNPQAELVSQTKKLVWRLGELEPGAERKIGICVVPLEEGQIGSVATVNFVAEVAAETVISAPKLEFLLDGPKSASVGSQVTYTFKLRNNGSADAADVWIRNLLPEQLKHPDGNDLEYEVGTLPAGESREVELILTAAGAGEVTNRAVVTAGGGVAVESSIDVAIVGSRLSVARTGPKQRYVGSPAVFTNTVKNDGQLAVAAAAIVEEVPEGMDFVQASDGGRFDAARRMVSWRVNGIGAGESRAVSVTLLPRGVGSYQSHVTVATESGRAELTSETSVTGLAALALDVPAVESPVAVGEQVALRIAARNRGNMAASNVRVTVTVPDELGVVAIQGPEYTRDGQTITFSTLPEVEARRQAEIDIVLQAREPGHARVGVSVSSDQLQRPLSREEIIYVLPAN